MGSGGAQSRPGSHGNSKASQGRQQGLWPAGTGCFISSCFSSELRRCPGMNRKESLISGCIGCGH